MKRARRRKAKSFLMTFLIGMASGLAVMPLFFVFVFVLRNGLPAFDWAFFTSLPAPMGQAGGGMANALLGSLILVAVAGAVAIPFGILVGVYLSEYKTDRFTNVVRFVVDLLMGIPSIVIGLFAYSIFVISMKTFSGWAGSFALIMIMLPPIVKSTEEVLGLVPVAVREAGLALGLSRWRVSLLVVLRGQKAAVTTGVMLAIARAGGETAPLLFTAFGNQFWPRSMSEPMPSLPVQIYNYAISPFPDAHRQAWAGACLLLVLMFLVNLLSRFLTSRGGR